MSTSNEHPILFSAAMVQAIRDGKKTQTRRIVKPQPLAPVSGLCRFTARGREWLGLECGDPRRISQHSPYGVPGSNLWVKETWCAAREYDHLAPSEIPLEGQSRLHYLADGPKPDWAGKTRVSIHMTRWASRITLGIADARVERLQDLTKEGALAEGVGRQFDEARSRWMYRDYLSAEDDFGWHSPLSSFHSLWGKINGADSWDANPYVWVVEFCRLEGA